MRSPARVCCRDSCFELPGAHHTGYCRSSVAGRRKCIRAGLSLNASRKQSAHFCMHATCRCPVNYRVGQFVRVPKKHGFQLPLHLFSRIYPIKKGWLCFDAPLHLTANGITAVPWAPQTTVSVLRSRRAVWRDLTRPLCPSRGRRVHAKHPDQGATFRLPAGAGVQRGERFEYGQLRRRWRFGLAMPSCIAPKRPYPLLFLVLDRRQQGLNNRLEFHLQTQL